LPAILPFSYRFLWSPIHRRRELKPCERAAK
jgi:hypothetical protein